ncbi:MAG TPA: hypothetical protein VFR86_04395 [Burkholderiaceae bacterium]|nr:hypothetical protein [Burkholderiaceae bacterium]
MSTFDRARALRAVKAAVLGALAAGAATAWAVPPQGSPYYADTQGSYVEDATSQGIGQVNMITCFMSSMKPADLVNQGNYLALVDEKKCDPNSRSSTSNQSASGGANAPQYMRATVNSSRASNADPMIAKIWVAEEDEGTQKTIFVRVAASEAPSNANPYGVFRLDFCGKGADEAASAACRFMGFLNASSGGMQFFEEGSEGQGSRTTQLALSSGSGGDSGQGRLAMSEVWQGGSQSTAFAFAYNSTHYLRNDTVTNQDMCFSRSEADAKKSVWRYGLYKEDGTRVEVNSGFPVTYTDQSTNTKYQGHMGYYGLWMEGDRAGSIPHGATLVRQNFDDPNSAGENFQLFKARGRLTKYVRKTTKLDRIANVRLHTSMEINGQWTNIEIYWDGALNQFVKSGVMSCGQNGCNIEPVPPEPIDNAFWVSRGGVFGWSNSLGGEVFIRDVANLGTPSLVDVIYREQSLVFPADIPAELKCLGDCANMASLQAFFTNQGATSPFIAGTQGNEWNANGVAEVNLVSYVQDGTSGELKAQGDSGALVITDASWLENQPQYQWGFRTGKLFNAADAAAVLCEGSQTNYCGNKLNDLLTYYQWETGTKQWNQFFALRAPSGNCAGSSDAYCRFDPPLNVTFTVPSNSTAYGEYAGRDVILQYGGFGNLWGIPGVCVNRFTNAPVDCSQGGFNTRFVPAFEIPFDATLGRVTGNVDGTSTTYYVKWLEREVRFSSVDVSNCASLTLPGNALALPTGSGYQNPGVDSSSTYIGTMPTVDAAPRVIDGEVKY